MNQLGVRGKAFLRRKAAHAIGYLPQRAVSLERQERPTEIDFDILGMYSRSESLEIYDPRTKNLKGHFFQQRDMYLLRNVILEPRQGLVYSEFGNLIKESTQWNPYVSYNTFPWNPDGKVNSTNLESAIYISSNTYWHWLIEDLATTIFALESNPNSPVLVASNPPKFVEDFLGTLDREVIILNGPVKVRSLILVSKQQDSGWPHPRDLLTLSNYVPFVSVIRDSSPGNKVYISRRGSRRSPANEKVVEKIFESFDFKILRLEEFNLISEIEELSKVTHLAGVHGAGLANLIWMNTNTKLLDISNSNYWTESIHRAAYLKHVNYEYLLYEGSISDEIPTAELEMKLGEL